jgi:hypothetical protein
MPPNLAQFMVIFTTRSPENEIGFSQTHAALRRASLRSSPRKMA